MSAPVPGSSQSRSSPRHLPGPEGDEMLQPVELESSFLELNATHSSLPRLRASSA